MSLDQMQAASLVMCENATCDLVAHVTARMCHDLASPLGAIGNGVELLEMLQGADTPELRLIAASVRQATARLRLFRFVFGPAQQEQMTSAEELRTLLHAHEESARFWVHYQIDVDIPRVHAKVILLGVMCLETALAWGGNVRIMANAKGYQLSAQADRLRLDAELWSTFDASENPISSTSANIHFNMLQREISQKGLGLHCVQTPHSLVFQVSIPRPDQE